MFFFLVLSSFSIPIERYQCGANINGNLFDITKLANGRKNGRDQINLDNNDRYYFKMCSTLTTDDLPPLSPDPTDISVMRCNYSSHECASAIPLQSFDWKLINPDNANEGVIYYAAGEPFIDPEDKKYYTIDFEIQFKCDPSSTATDVDYTYQIHNESNEVFVRIQFQTAYGCPKTTVPPTPTPSFNPDCQFTYYLLPLSKYGFHADFKLLNGGPYGIRSALTVAEPEGEKDRILFYQPCERMKCPLNYTCTSNEYSSAWLCSKDNRLCESYGLISEDGIDAEIEHFSRESAVRIIHHLANSNTGKSISLNVGCNRKYEYDHFAFTPNASISTSNKLEVEASTHDVCYGYNPKPIPPFANDVCAVKSSSFGVLNLSLLNQENGYITTIPNTKQTLYFQPCGGLNCPSESQCDGDTNATIWLCDDTAGYHDCIAYGLLENNLTYTFLSSHTLSVDYFGDRKRLAAVTFSCDEQVDSSTLRLPEKVELDGTRLHFRVYSSRFCAATSSNKSLSGGAIFLIILAVGIVLYVGITMLIVYFRTGKIEPPNKEFWIEFFACVSTAFLFIIRCGNHGNSVQTRYDAI